MYALGCPCVGIEQWCIVYAEILHLQITGHCRVQVAGDSYCVCLAFQVIYRHFGACVLSDVLGLWIMALCYAVELWLLHVRSHFVCRLSVTPVAGVMSSECVAHRFGMYMRAWCSTYVLWLSLSSLWAICSFFESRCYSTQQIIGLETGSLGHRWSFTLCMDLWSLCTLLLLWVELF